MDHNGGNFPPSWAAVLDPNFAPHGLPMDLHVSQSFSFYRYRDDIPFGWNERKPVIDVQASAVNSRILELRKEKSRDAARSRRGKENFEFYELAKMLPLPAAITSQLDKASIIRLTMSYLKLREFTQHGDPQWPRDNKAVNRALKSNPSSRRNTFGLALEMFEQHQGTHILQSLDGFTFAVAADGRFLYISETVSIYLGLSQVEMTGSSIFEYIHQSDHAEIAEQLGLCLATNNGMNSPTLNDEPTGTNNPDVSSIMSLNGSSYKGYERAFCVRMKSTLTKRGCHFKSSGYRVVLLLCHLRPQHSFSNTKKSSPQILGMTAIAVALPPPSLHEIRLESDMFVTRVDFDLRISHCEAKISELLDYSPEDLVGESLYNFCHAEDAAKLRKCHMDLISKGQVLTHYYRLMGKHGGYIWIQTCGTVVCSAKNNDEQHIVCVNYVVSGRENINMLFDQCQLGIKREPGTFKANKPKSADVNDCSEVKSGLNESKSSDLSMNSASHETSHKVVEPSTRNHEDDVDLSCTSQKRGRKRKLKYETKDEESTSTLTISAAPNDISVKDLVNVMSKHLPKMAMNDDENSAGLHLRQQSHKDEIVHENAHISHQSPTMPATALLRQLYAKRESVIRATTTRPANYMFTEGSHQHSLPTPPNDSYDAYLRKSNEGFSHYSGAYNSMDYGMTPPSSVSPRDLTHHKSYDYTNLGDTRGQYQMHSSESSSHPHLPLKPQPYSLQMDPAYSIDHQSQYFPYHSGFHLYHKGVYTPP